MIFVFFFVIIAVFVFVVLLVLIVGHVDVGEFENGRRKLLDRKSVV